MKKKEKICPEVATCSVDYAFKRIGGKYKGKILWYLHEHSILRYGELSRTMSDITTKLLTQTLWELETDHLIDRKVYHEGPFKVEYTLTEVSNELIPFIRYLKKSGNKQIKEELKNAK
ncbi:winged helix-turn-helix transcriptional regulator [Adhaeribacter radiodurans]|uniref:Helix-turn-helix transcriptional regulator n=1 Tax=Adhaeribacter radiodurans TaxID=2745197 RepID=A0A7L7LA49_9BACT|nr:helix-turn-helix domain-containing protein [Adhaeribacter radiodurans]QMU29711.1 helix-turn-helix transcriptional regulator [Adhaeribacter radiodurans]